MTRLPVFQIPIARNGEQVLRFENPLECANHFVEWCQRHDIPYSVDSVTPRSCRVSAQGMVTTTFVKEMVS